MDTYLYGAVRTPFGRFNGGLAGVRPDDLAAGVIESLLATTPGPDRAEVDEVVWGNANGAGEENRNVGRMASLLAGLPPAGSSPGTVGSPDADDATEGGADPAGLQAVPWFWSDQYDLTLQVSGLADLAERWVTRPRPDGTEVLLGLASDGRLVCAAITSASSSPVSAATSARSGPS